MNMREWMLKRPPYIKKYEEEGTLRKHIFDSMLDLATGVAFIHREISGKVGYHRDIKPENILLFNKPDRPEFTWKICDFGCANLKSIDRTGTLNLRTDPHWAPPEVIGATEEGYSETRGRAHDVYSLGCIFVLLATFLIYGWEPAGLAIFNKRRQEYVGNGDDVDINGPECAFHCTMNVARGWIAELPPEAPNDLRGQIEALIVLIGEMVRPIEERIYSWEVEVDLHMIIHPDLSELALLQILKEAIQSSRTLNHGIKHNPMRRAKEARKPQSFLKMLEDAKWYDHTPGSTEELKRRKADVSKYHSTLKAPPYEDSLFGFQKLDQRIAELFASKVDSVALYGLGGMGYVITTPHS
jgi:serine/threonine protein kinase